MKRGREKEVKRGMKRDNIIIETEKLRRMPYFSVGKARTSGVGVGSHLISPYS